MADDTENKKRQTYFSDLEKTRSQHSKNSLIGIVIGLLVICLVVALVELGFV